MSSETTSDSNRYQVPALARGIAILRLFNAQRSVISAPEMAMELGFPRSTVFRLANTLCDLGLLQKVAHGQAFQLGMGLLSLGFEYLASLEISELGRPVLEQLAADTGYTCHLVLRDGLDVVVVYKAQGRSALSGSLTIGSRLPAHATVLGRASLMDFDLTELNALFQGVDLVRYSKDTPRDVKALYEHICRDRERGYGISDGFFEQGISAIAAPVRDHSGAAFGAINITLPGSIKGYEDLPRLIDTLKRQAAHLSNLLAHSGKAMERWRDVG